MIVLSGRRRAKRFYPAVGAGVETVYATFAPGVKGSGITLSGADLTETGAASGVVLATVGKSSGKCYWEITVGGNSSIVGIAQQGVDLDGFLGGAARGIGYFGPTGDVFNAASSTAYGATFTTSDVIGVALDMDAGKVWFSKNGTWQNSGDPATGTNPAASLSGTWFPAASNFNPSASTANFGATAFTYTPPTGFNAGVYVTDGLTSNIVFEGDSITSAGATFADYAALLIGPSIAYQKTAVGGSVIADLVSRATADDALISATRSPDVLFVFAGTNDINDGASAATATADLKSYCLARRAAGWKVIVATPISRITVDATITDYTNAIIADSSFYDVLCDFHADTRFDAGSYSDTTYYSGDGVHPGAVGQAALGVIAKAAILAVT